MSVEQELDLNNYLTHKKEYSEKWQTKTCENKYVQKVLDKSSKKCTGNRGEPDLIYCNDTKKLLILLENKNNVKFHVSDDGKNDPVKYAVDGVKHYLSFFLEKNLPEESVHLKDWKIIGIAFSGDITDEYNKRIDTFYIFHNHIINTNIHEFKNELDYISLVANHDLENITEKISKSSKFINEKLRSTETNNRSILLSALMVSLLDKPSNDFRENYKDRNPDSIADEIPRIVKKILKDEKIESDKIEILTNQLSFLKTDIELRETSTLKEILDELKNNVIPLFSKGTNYDIIGRFYSEFLRYAGVTDVKKGIVLTPRHITSLFVSLIDLSPNDIIFDPCCGTGSFLIAGMNEINEIIDNSGFPDKEMKKENLKKQQLLGFEINSTMYSLAISNMLFRGDGKSKIYNIDFFNENAKQILNNVKPTIGFINPPYGGKDTVTYPTKKEIQFLERMLDNVSKWGIIIAPTSTSFKDPHIRKRILSKHTLKYVIHMPTDLFQPNASTHTVISVFETQNPHNNKEVVFYDLKDDGFILYKNKGRADVYNNWDEKKTQLLNKLKNPENYSDDPNLLKTKITDKDEWIIYAHMKTNYDNLSEVDFRKSIKENVIFNTKKNLNLLNEDLDEITLLEILNSDITEE